MISRKHSILLAGSCVALAWGGWGCLSMQSQSTIDGANNNVGNSNQPYVEAYVEYPGPQQKWSGPASFILHVTAKDAGAAQITTTPALPSDEGPTVMQRTPAASGSAPTLAQGYRPMTSEEARSQLAHLVSALQGAQAPFRGCMSPVRVRLVRADGGLFERQGCRSEMGWSRAVSETVSAFINASLHGMQGAPQVAAAPAGVPATAPATTPAKESPNTARTVASERH